MKITPEHYQVIRKRMASTIEDIGREKIMDRYYDLVRMKLSGEQNIKDPHMRLRWDLLWLSRLSEFVCDEIYTYADDDHLDTALRKAMSELLPELNTH